MGENALALISVAGPMPVQQPLTRDRALTIGRRNTHALMLDRPEVSRDHAELRPVETASGPAWVMVDLGSRHRTRVNGQELRPGEPCPIRQGDLIEIAPWTFRLVRAGGTTLDERMVSTVDDSGGASLRTITAAPVELAQERLRLLLGFAEAITAAIDEASLARAAVDAAVRGTGFPNAAVLRPLMPDGTVSILAQTGEITAPGAASIPRLSRSLIRQASHGVAVQMGGDMMVSPEAHSIVALNIQEAMCVPIMLEGAAAGYLYLDAREQGRGRRTIAKDAGAFAIGLARLAALALHNLMRRDLETRYARMEGEIAAAGRAQSLILPPRESQIGSVRVIGECRAGRIASGDLFDVIRLSDGRVAVALGDVAGKGIQASVLMTTTQGFLHGALAQHGDPTRAVDDLNAYLAPRCEAGAFLSLWLGVIDVAQGRLEYVDAGHGYAWLKRAAGELCTLNELGGLLVGVDRVTVYRAAHVDIAPGDRLMLVSDGIIEQPRGANRGEVFGWEGVRRVIAHDAPVEKVVSDVFDALGAHAGQPALADDATVVLATW